MCMSNAPAHMCMCASPQRRDKIFARRPTDRPTGEGKRKIEVEDEGARRNATGLSSPLINTSKATCKAARVGSRVRLGEPPYPLRAIRPRAPRSVSLSLSLSAAIFARLVSSYSCLSAAAAAPILLFFLARSREDPADGCVARDSHSRGLLR